MVGYLKTAINFTKLEKTLEAAKALDAAGDTKKAKEILKSLADVLLEELKE